ncbi:MAG: hypothetical protein AAF702_36335 [Chloroflexota bacterium]
MAPKTFDDVLAIHEHFETPVYRDLADDSLLVYDQIHFVWHRYRWTHGRREIKFVESLEGELPIMVQVYPTL